jgi:hypothetical protein
VSSVYVLNIVGMDKHVTLVCALAHAQANEEKNDLQRKLMKSEEDKVIEVLNPRGCDLIHIEVPD